MLPGERDNLFSLENLEPRILLSGEALVADAVAGLETAAVVLDQLEASPGALDQDLPLLAQGLTELYDPSARLENIFAGLAAPDLASAETLRAALDAAPGMDARLTPGPDGAFELDLTLNDLFLVEAEAALAGRAPDGPEFDLAGHIGLNGSATIELDLVVRPTADGTVTALDSATSRVLLTLEAAELSALSGTVGATIVTSKTAAVDLNTAWGISFAAPGRERLLYLNDAAAAARVSAAATVNLAGHAAVTAELVDTLHAPQGPPAILRVEWQDLQTTEPSLLSVPDFNGAGAAAAIETAGAGRGGTRADTIGPYAVDFSMIPQPAPGVTGWELLFTEVVDAATFTSADVLVDTGATTLPSSDITVTALPGTTYSQWASTVLDYSSQRFSSSWSASRATGAPNVSSYGSNSNAWAAQGQEVGAQYITLGYEFPVAATAVTVRETYNCGFVTQIELLDTDDVFHSVWTGTDPSAAGAIADYRIEFARTDYLVKGVRVTTDTDLVAGYEQIDAIALHSEDPAGQTSAFSITFPADTALTGYTVTVGPNLADMSGNGLDQDRNGTGGEGTDVVQGALDVSVPTTVSGTLHGTHFWAGTVHVTGNTWVATDGFLDILPGTVVKVNQGVYVTIDGSLNAYGTPANPVVFTSYRDDGRGLDVTGPGTETPAAGDWEALYLESTSANAAHLVNVEVRYGGNKYSPGDTSGRIGAVYVNTDSADVTLTDVTVADADGSGVQIYDGAPTLTRVSARDCYDYAFYRHHGADPGLDQLSAVDCGIDGFGIAPGTMNADRTWSDFGGLVGVFEADFRVGSGHSLTLGAGLVLKLKTGRYIDADGTLTAVGSVAQPIVFTALTDDTHGGDTNADGSATTPVPGDWEAIYFSGGAAASNLAHVEIHYAGNRYSPGDGGGLHAAVRIDDDVTLTDVYVNQVENSGIHVYAGSPDLTNVQVVSAGGAAFSGRVSADPATTNLTATGCGINGYYLEGGTVGAARAWNIDGLPIHFGGDITVGGGVELTIAAGQILKLSDGMSLYVYGTLDAAGTAAQPILFTSNHDDTVGGDSNNDGAGTLPQAGDWQAIYLYAGAAGSTIEHWEVRYGGNLYNPDNGSGRLSTFRFEDTTVAVSNVAVKYANGWGVWINGGSPTLDHMHVSNGDEYAFGSDLDAVPTLSSLTAADNGTDSFNLYSGVLYGSKSWTLTTLPYTMDADITVANGATLTVSPGVVVKFRNAQELEVDGTLDARGTLAQPIIFTSYRDDSLYGDTFHDGSDVPQPGDWHRVRFDGSGSSGSVVEHLDLRYAGNYYSPDHGSGYATALNVTNSAATIRSSRVRDVNMYGVGAYGGTAAPTFEQVRVERARTAAFSMDAFAAPGFTGVSAADSGENAILVQAQTIAEDRTWDGGGLPYTFAGDVTVGASATLTLVPGTVVKLSNGNTMWMDGSMNAVGTAAEPIIFTSYRDDSAGGDSNNDGAATNPDEGDWHMLHFDELGGATPPPVSVLDYVELRYGGNYYSPHHGSGYGYGSMRIEESITASHLTVLYSNDFGIRVNAGAPTFDHVTIRDSRDDAFYVELDTDPVITNATFTGNYGNRILLSGGPLNDSMLLDTVGVPYSFSSDITVGSAGTLTIAADVVLKLDSGKSLNVDGVIDVNGTAGHPVIFTSWRDDSLLNDLYSDGMESAQPGDWHYLYIKDACTSATLDYLELRYGGNYYNAGHGSGYDSQLYVYADTTATGLIVRDGDEGGVCVRSDATLTVSGGLISDNRTHGVWVDDGNAVFTGVGFYACTNGIWVDNGESVSVTSSEFGQMGNAIVYAGSGDFTHAVATGNWWGSAGGPHDVSAADGVTNNNPAGEPVGDWVDYSGWLGAAPGANTTPYVLGHGPTLTQRLLTEIDLFLSESVDSATFTLDDVVITGPGGTQTETWLVVLDSVVRIGLDVPADAASAFSAGTNPTGPWRYGWLDTPGGTFTTYVDNWEDPTDLHYWGVSGAPAGAPFIAHDLTGSPWPGNTWYSSRHGQLTMHPGIGGEYSALRWTAPSTGTYDIFTGFEGVQNTTTQVLVLHNGSALFDGDISAYRDRESYTGTVSVLAGDTIDVVVGYANGSYAFDSTAVQAMIIEHGSWAATDYTITFGPDVTGVTGFMLDQDRDGTGGEPSEDVYTGTITVDRTGPRITALSPATAQTTPVAYVDVTFSEAVDAGTFSRDDVTITAPGAVDVVPLGVVPLSATELRILFAPQAVNGVYDLSVGPGVTDLAGNLMNQDNDGTNGEDPADVYDGQFEVDLEPVRITSHSPTGTVSTAMNHLDLTFGVPISAGSFNTDDVRIVGPQGTVTVTGVSAITDVLYRVSFASISAEGDYEILVGPDVQDATGNLMDQDADGNQGEPEDRYAFTITLEGVGPYVTGHAPSATVAAPASSFTVTFSETILASTFTPVDVRLEGPGGGLVGVTGVTPGPDDSFVIQFQPQTATGTYTFTIGPYVYDLANVPMNQDTDGANGEAEQDKYTGQFNVDNTGPTVTSHDPSGGLEEIFSQVTLTFGEPVMRATFGVGDVTITGPGGAVSVWGVDWIDDSTYRVRFPGQDAPGTYSFRIGPQITDFVGNAMDEDGDTVFGEAADAYEFDLILSLADLAFSSHSVPAAVFAGATFDVDFTVINNGGADAGQPWTARAVLSSDEYYGNWDDVLIGEAEVSTVLTSLQTQPLQISGPAPWGYEGAYTVLVKLDRRGQVEESDETNNLLSTAIQVNYAPPPADLMVDAVTAPAAAGTGTAFDVAWRVTNHGTAATPVAAWSDRVYLSTDAVWGGDTDLGTFAHTGALAADGNYTQVQTVLLPETLDAGQYWLLVLADVYNQLAEPAAEDNNLAASQAAVTVTLSPVPDLTVSAVAAATAAANAGATVQVDWTVTNGAAAASGSWSDRVYLALDGSGDLTGAHTLGTFTHSGGLAGAGTYDSSETVTLPVWADADYHIVVVTDVTDVVFERAGDSNNVGIAAVPLALLHPNLTVDSVVTVAAADSGADITVDWQVSNTGTGPAPAPWVDRIYLSTDASLSGDDLVLGELTHATALADGRASYNGQLIVQLPDGIDGTYNVLVVTDADAAVEEVADESDNDGASSALAVSLAPYADLATDNVTAPSLVIGDPVDLTVSWRVTNTGTGAGPVDTWQDRVILSTDDTVGNGDDLVIGSFTHTGLMPIGTSYTAQRSSSCRAPRRGASRCS